MNWWHRDGRRSPRRAASQAGAVAGSQRTCALLSYRAQRCHKADRHHGAGDARSAGCTALLPLSVRCAARQTQILVPKEARDQNTTPAACRGPQSCRRGDARAQRARMPRVAASWAPRSPCLPTCGHALSTPSSRPLATSHPAGLQDRGARQNSNLPVRARRHQGPVACLLQVCLEAQGQTVQDSGYRHAGSCSAAAQGQGTRIRCSELDYPPGPLQLLAQPSPTQLVQHSVWPGTAAHTPAWPLVWMRGPLQVRSQAHSHSAALG